MSDTIVAVVGKKGRVVMPKPLRDGHHWEEGTSLVFIDRPEGVLVMTRTEALRAVRKSLTGAGSLAEELIAERRSEAAREAKR
ncbi:MAG: AbrB/MazE/SpoVT family DNA-binding domain-containing protein [Bifidobacteriaceae bacterium]|jgi:AbrB family looped-hinge helix DNA binding protein|nr:AbrB/MazE/SpoVT family DNA-binding domain-containing protein [Bifidobacteriaceae bacterium]